MRRRAAVGVRWALAASLACAAPVSAGPWARADGDVFISFSLSTEDTRDAVMIGDPDLEAKLGLYGELGLGHGLTAGVDLSYGESGGMGSVFLRRTLTSADAPFQAALHLGIGQRRIEGEPSETLLRLGGSIGQGFGAAEVPVPWMPFGHEGGWATLDAAAFFDSEGVVRVWQTEATIGLRLSDRLSALLGVKAEDWTGSDRALTARPSVLYDLGGDTTLQTGLVIGLANSETLGLSLSVWRDF